MVHPVTRASLSSRAALGTNQCGLLLFSRSSSLRRLTDLHHLSFPPQSPPVVSGWKESVPGCHSRGQRAAMPAGRGEAQSASIFTNLNDAVFRNSTSIHSGFTCFSLFKLQKFDMARRRHLRPPAASLGNRHRSHLPEELFKARGGRRPRVASSSRRVRVGGRVTSEQRADFASLHSSSFSFVVIIFFRLSLAFSLRFQLVD